ncbi:MAG TPA: serine/threonine-protein kinase [Burkholderiales bacterium]|jgi:serine/threonine-protein kinase
MPQIERIGKYQITEVVGRGAMGVVYKAFDPNIRRTVAIKTIRLDAAEDDRTSAVLTRFRNEAQAAGRLSHPGIVGVYEYGEDEGLAYIAMEFIQGNSLREYFARGTRFGEADTVSTMTQLLEALSYAHEQGVWHRDIKPANLIVMRNGKLKVADFGIARIDSSSLTQTGFVMGTPGYMAPEQYTGGALDWRADVFSAGVVMYELLTGVKPFAGTVESAAYKVCHENPLPPSQVRMDPPVPVAYDAIVARAIAKKPRERFESANAFRCALLDAHAAPVSATLSEETIITEAARPMKIEPTNPSSSTNPPTPTAGRTTTPPPGWDPALLKQIESHFARFVGPVAKVMVRRAGRRTLDVDELYTMMARELDTEQQRTAFMSTRGTLTGVTRPPSAAAPRGNVSGDAELTSDKIEAAQRKLAAYIGPIAKVLVKKAAAQTASSERFYLLLAESLSDIDRTRFLKEVGAGSAAGRLR